MMNYYQHHIGDFIKATARLSDTQAMTYLRLIWVYYDSEAPLPDDPEALAFQVGGSQDDIRLILKSFFRLQDDGWHQLRCDREILDYHAMIEKRKKAGVISGEKRRSKTYKEHKLNTCSADDELTNNQYPITSNQSIKGANAPAPTTLPPCPQEDLIRLYAKHLPHLTQPRIWDGARAASLRQRWQQCAKPSAGDFGGGYESKDEGLKFWDSFFGYIANGTTLAKGFESQGRVWRPDLEWICKPANFAKIVDGKYAK
jgi:uncharacterized protein YdaU (DUF1376 family)